MPSRLGEVELLHEHLSQHSFSGELQTNAADVFFTELIQRPYSLRLAPSAIRRSEEEREAGEKEGLQADDDSREVTQGRQGENGGGAAAGATPQLVDPLAVATEILEERQASQQQGHPSTSSTRHTCFIALGVSLASMRATERRRPFSSKSTRRVHPTEVVAAYLSGGAASLNLTGPPASRPLVGACAVLGRRFGESPRTFP